MSEEEVTDGAVTDPDAAAEEDPAAAETRARPDSGGDPGPEEPYGTPGPPVDRLHPFVVGFVGALGALTAYWLFQAFAGIGSVLLLVVVAFFLAAGLYPAVEFLERRGLRRSIAVTAVIVAAVGIAILFFVAIVPVITDQVTKLTEAVPGWLERLSENQRVANLNAEYGIVDRVQEFVTAGDFLSTLFGGALGIGLQIVSAVFNLFVIVVLTLYFLASLETTTSALYRLAPASRRERVSMLGDKVIHNIGQYVSGAFVVALCAGTSTLLFLWFTEVREYAVALAFVVAVLDVIPMIGATIGAVIVSSIAFATDVQAGIACVIFFLIYQQVENYLIYPRVMGKAVDLPGAVIVIAALVGASLLGVVGALLAIPFAAAVQLIVREVWVRKQDLR